MGEHDGPPRPRNVPAGYDENNPYRDVDLAGYPGWWRRNVEQFRDYGMRPYRPPRFTDGEYTPEVIERLEAEFDVDVLFRAVDPRLGDDWSVVVDGEEVASVERYRSGDGYTVYELSSEEFRSVIRENSK